MYNRDTGTGRKTSDPYAFSGEGPQGSGECTAVLGTMTAALQAQRTLSNAAIHAAVIKISSSKSAKGCAYGITFACAQTELVRTVLGRAGISVKKYMGG